jgi:hypothetical protein
VSLLCHSTTNHIPLPYFVIEIKYQAVTIKYYNSVYIFLFLPNMQMRSIWHCIMFSSSAVFWASHALLYTLRLSHKWRDTMINVCRSLWKVSVVFYSFNETSVYMVIWSEISNIKFHENVYSSSWVVPCGQTDRHDAGNCCLCCCFANMCSVKECDITCLSYYCRDTTCSCPMYVVAEQ